MRKLPIYVSTFPLDLVMWGLVLIVNALWGTGLRWIGDALTTELRAGSWPVNPMTFLGGWYLMNRREAVTGAEPWPWGGTTVGRAIMFGPGRRPTPGAEPTSILVHELHHVLQAKVYGLAGFVNATVAGVTLMMLGHFVAGAVVWVTMWLLGGYALVGGAGFAVAWLERHPSGIYRGSQHEIGAYGVSDSHKP